MAVTLIVGCRNRFSYLQESLPTWLVHPQIKYIYIIDWESDVPVVITTKKKRLSEKLLPCRKGKKGGAVIEVIRVEGIGRWILTLALNFIATFVTTEWLLKVDADTMLSPNFFKFHPQTPTIFYAGNWKAARDENEKHLNGVLYVRTDDFRAVNGYNEYIRSYGYDDSDLYDRLEKNGLLRKDFDFNMLTHQSHPDTIRDPSADLRLEIMTNMFVSQKRPWGKSQVPVKYRQVREKVYEPIDLSLNRPTPELVEECRLLAMRCILNDNYRISWLLTSGKNTIRDLYRRRNNPLLIIDCKNGLGNRLRALASAAVIAEKLDRILVVIWSPDYHNESLFSDLFISDILVSNTSITYDPEVIVQFAHPPAVAPTGDILLESLPNPLSSGDSSSTEDPEPAGTPTIKVDYVAKHGENMDPLLDRKVNLYIVSSCVLNSSHTNWTLEANWLRKNLVNRPEIESKIAEWSTRFNISTAIGLHIRMGQELPAESVKGWSQQSAKSLVENRRISHYIYFMHEIQRILRSDPTQRFVVCADNSKIYKVLQRRFGENILYYPRQHWDRSKDQMVEALLEVTLLSKCKRCIGSPWSSYSELIARLGGQVKIMGKDIPLQKFGAVFADTLNIGDAVQTLAAIQFYPNVDYWLERDNLQRVPSSMKIILNGWFDGRLTTWPPSGVLYKLPISIHINESSQILADKNYNYLIPTFRRETMLSKESLPYWRLMEPIGCRDAHTLSLLENIGVKGYLSSCLTLTLKRDPTWKASGKIYNVEGDEISSYKRLVPDQIQLVARRIRHGLFEHEKLSVETKMTEARRLLRKYGQAKYIITSRLHAALPALAFGVPVLFLHEKIEEDPRFDETLKFILGNGRSVPSWWNWENPQLPSSITEKIKEIRRDLKRRVRDFIELDPDSEQHRFDYEGNRPDLIP